MSLVRTYAPTLSEPEPEANGELSGGVSGALSEPEPEANGELSGGVLHNKRKSKKFFVPVWPRAANKIYEAEYRVRAKAPLWR